MIVQGLYTWQLEQVSLYVVVPGLFRACTLLCQLSAKLHTQWVCMRTHNREILTLWVFTGYSGFLFKTLFPQFPSHFIPLYYCGKCRKSCPVPNPTLGNRFGPISHLGSGAGIAGWKWHSIGKQVWLFKSWVLTLMSLDSTHVTLLLIFLIFYIWATG